MEIKLILPKNTPIQHLGNLKNFIDKSSIDGVQSTEIERSSDNDNKMGVGEILGSVKTILEATTKPLTELVKCLQKYVDTFRTEIFVETPAGTIKISAGRNMKPKELESLVTNIQINFSQNNDRP